MICGLLGRKLSHSYSPQIHEYLGDYSYELWEKEPEQLCDFLRSGDFTGLNVTIPYKKDVIPFCDKLTDTAKKLGAVNTIVRQSNGSLIGHNTDYFGFSSMVLRGGLAIEGKKVLVLGSGGASNTVVAVLQEMGAKAVVISRSGEDNYTNLHRHADASVIVNTTPVGMYPHTGDSPVCLDGFPQLEGVLDLIYNPARTQLLQDAAQRELVTENGLWMLVAQAKEAAEWFLHRAISDSCIEEICQAMRKKMENIVLIGMPGCGKSTISKLLAAQTGRIAVDADEEIIRLAGCSIPEIFSKGGEEEFRKLETEVLSQLGKQSGLIIATGGGCIMRKENYCHLHQNGTILWLTRNLDNLPVGGRPLSQANKLEDLYNIRQPLYRDFADHIIDNNGAPEETLAAIRRLL